MALIFRTLGSEASVKLRGSEAEVEQAECRGLRFVNEALYTPLPPPVNFSAACASSPVPVTKAESQPSASEEECHTDGNQ